MHLLIEVLGWAASALIVGAYALNIYGKLDTKAPAYIWANLVGGTFFIVNTYAHQAYPSAVVNVVWVLIALNALFRQRPGR